VQHGLGIKEDYRGKKKYAIFEDGKAIKICDNFMIE